jgi:uncharacterized membrane protein
MVMDPSSQINTSLIGLLTVIDGAVRLDGLCVMLLGLITLIAIPVTMIILNTVRFALERDVLYMAFSLIVIVNLMLAVVALPAFLAA